MVRRKFTMIDIVEILEHWYSGRSIAVTVKSVDASI
jgi:hypothetical protein